MARLYPVIDKRLYDELKEVLGMRKVPKKVWEDILFDWSINQVVEKEEYEPVQLVIEVDNDVYDTFRKAVKYVYGNKRGSVSKAVQSALWHYLDKRAKFDENKKKIVKKYLDNIEFEDGDGA